MIYYKQCASGYVLISLFYYFIFIFSRRSPVLVRDSWIGRWFEGYAIHESAGWFEGYAIQESAGWFEGYAIHKSAGWFEGYVYMYY